MQKLIAKYAAAAGIWRLLRRLSLAQDLAPDALLRAVSVEVIDKLRQDQELPGSEPGESRGPGRERGSCRCSISFT